MIATKNESCIIDVLVDIFRAKGVEPPTLGPDTVLDQLGLESLDFAQAVIRLEEVTGKDPFATGTEFHIRTLSDFATVYGD